MVGLLEDPGHATTLSFKKEGDAIYLIGNSPSNLNGSLYLREVLEKKLTPCPDFDLETEYNLHVVITEIIRHGYAKSAHDLSEGGMFVALLESALSGKIGFNVEIAGERTDIELFSESQSRIIISVDPSNEGYLKQILDKQQIPFTRLGTVQGKDLLINHHNYGSLPEWDLLYNESLTKILEQ
jgi:phosphoribosylformylglycinamidine synthase